jgi:hypothetical protein
MKEAFITFRAKLLEEIFKQPEYHKKDYGLKAFGKFEAFVKSDASAVMTDTRFIQYGTPYSVTMEKGHGRRATPFKDIYEWLNLRKYDLGPVIDKIGQATLAERIVRKHEREGSYKFRNPKKRTKVIETAIEKATPTLYAALLEFQKAEVQSQVKNEIDKINGHSK